MEQLTHFKLPSLSSLRGLKSMERREFRNGMLFHLPVAFRISRLHRRTHDCDPVFFHYRSEDHQGDYQRAGLGGLGELPEIAFGYLDLERAGQFLAGCDVGDHPLRNHRVAGGNSPSRWASPC